MLDLGKWRIDRFVRLFTGLALAVTAMFFKGGYFVALLSAGIALVFTAVNGRCPFNACEVRVPAEKDDAGTDTR